MPAQTFFGKYRGQVQNNIDPMQQGRVQISCPAVLGEGSLSWAMPCAWASNGLTFGPRFCGSSAERWAVARCLRQVAKRDE